MKKYKDLVNSLEMLFSVRECKEKRGGGGGLQNDRKYL